jgi:antitoxin (DNA-binding transcriptional repressor) of toxin-antitoxin stability system
VITKKGKAVAALIPMSDEDVERLALSLDPKFIEIIERSRASIAENGVISLEEMEALFADDDGPTEA